MTDKDKPSTWVRYRLELCVSCIASCCAMPVEVRLSDLLRLGLVQDDESSPKKIAKRLAKEKIIRSYRAGSELFMLQQQADGACVFLGKDRLCSVYENRPDTCRGFPLDLGPRVGFCPYGRKVLRK